MMKIRGTNIPERILKTRNKRISGPAIFEMVRDIYNHEAKKEEIIHQNLLDDSDIINNDFELDLLETDRIFHLDDIEKICINYRLRFLSSSIFKGELPYDAVIEIKKLEKEHNISLKGFQIMAPADMFKLKNADDPLLFAPIGNKYYYLIHSWGNDLHPFRKLLMWPFRELEHFAFFLFVLSLLLTSVIPMELFSKEPTTAEFFMLFFFMFKWVAGMAIFIGFKKGKNFSAAIWRSNYFNG
jgi:hypothetical protein